MIKVLMVMTDLRAGNGTASAIMPYYQFLVENGYGVDFLLFNHVPSPWDEIITKYGSKLFYISKSKFKLGKKTIASIIDVLGGHDYDIIHINIVGVYAVQVLYLAKRKGITARVFHAHSPINRSKLSVKGVINDLCNRLILHYSTDYIACSSLAGKSRLGNRNFSILRNCIEGTRYIYDPSRRDAIRRKCGIKNDAFVLGTVARMSEEKNPMFSIDVFEAIKSINSNAFFLWIGDGRIRTELERYIQKKGLADSVLLVGEQTNVGEWYSAMDTFILPSLYEGLGIVCIEAQTSGLPVYASTMVPSDTQIAPYMYRIPLETGAKQWAIEILNNVQQITRSDGIIFLENSEYETKDNNSQLYEIYSGIIENGREK